jgi:conjugative relaxase-like TrwC/TraI family protein
VLRCSALPVRGAAYYLADLARELEAVGGPERAPGPRWVGRAAGPLGLSGPAGPDDLEALLEGRVPGRPGRLAARVPGRAGLDLTFAAPKSVSVLLALGGRQAAGAVLAAQGEAVAGALTYLERRAAAVRRGTGEDRTLLAVDGVVGAAFTHGVSRALEPHLHTHVVVANLAHGADGRWSALDHRGLWAHARAAGALYDAHLRRALGDDLGLGWRRAPTGALEVDGLDPALRGAFSSRAAEIRARGGGRRAAVVTREDKVAVRHPDALARRWRDTAAALGADPGAWTRTPGRTRPEPGVLDEYRFAAELARASPSGPRRRHVVAAWAAAVTDGVRADEVDRAVTAWVGDDGTRGVDEPALRPADLVPPGPVLAALGPRPAGARDQGPWRQAAAALQHYRDRWPGDRVLPGGPGDGPAARARLGPRRLAQHLVVERQVREAARAMGRDRAQGPDGRARGA